ncbi:MAG TPA: NarK/NasA family nitrate transporter [Planctomycetes bacterium]|nr:NarK/NasA family nitrate transporter [Planctomycetota bacterium]
MSSDGVNTTPERTPVDTRTAWWILGVNTFAFTICFAAWMMYGVLVTWLINNGLYDWGPSEIGWLIGIPVLTGAVFRLPLGIATDKWGGRIVYGLLLLFCAVPMYLTSYCNGYWQFFAAGLGFGLCGASFAVGIAYTSVWFPQHQQGTALGIFGAGNAGAALTSFGAPTILNWLTNDGTNIDAWRTLPKIYAALLLTTGVVFILTTKTRLAPGSAGKSLAQRLEPLRHMRVWRFGLYYFFVFGGFVALAQWLVPYYVNAYSTTVVLAGVLAACNSLPSGIIRAAGGWMSDRLGARTVMYWVLGASLICCILLIVPQMDIRSPGSGIMAKAPGTVISVTDEEIVVATAAGNQHTYTLLRKSAELVSDDERKSRVLVLPRQMSWQESVVEVGQTVANKDLLARGITQIYFQPNIWIFTVLSMIIGAVMGIGKAAVYKHIPDYFPNDVGVVGGIVGVLGGLGGFVCPVIFGYLLKATGLWTSCWMFFAVLVTVCLVWMHLVIQKMLKTEAPELSRRIESSEATIISGQQ